MGIALNALIPVARAEIEVFSAGGSQLLFAGAARSVKFCLRNAEDQPAEIRLQARLYQTSSATAIQMGEKFWKTVRVLPQQTLIETALIDFPDVRAETPFLIQWLDGTNRVLGKTEVLVYPTNLLSELKTLAGDNPLAVLDPNNQLKPCLKNLAVGFSDLENDGIENFSGKLAVIGPFSSKAQMRESLADRIATLAKKGKAVVWILPPPEPRDKLQPSFYAVPEGSGCVVVAQADMVSNLAGNPRAQLKLLHFARLALRPEPPRLPCANLQ